MRFPRLASWLLPVIWKRTLQRRQPDFIIGNDYCRRWWLIPRNRFFNIYVHHFLHSDDDRALHDHPWHNMTLVLSGCYVEHGEGTRKLRRPGDLIFRRARTPHRVQLPTERGYCWTLFVTGPVTREWGFHCPQGWRHWTKFTRPNDPGQIGPGCE